MIFFLFKFFFLNQDKNIKIKQESEKEEERTYNSNIIENVNYVTTDSDGNEYIVNAEMGEIDYSNPNIIYLTNVEAQIKPTNTDKIKIFSNFGKYNSQNFDTIFTKNVIIIYLDNKITGEYLDFSLERNSIIISKKVIYSNLKNILKADVIELDIKTKDTKIFMHEENQKVNIKNKNGNN